jgi:Transposase DDE domain
VAYVRTVKTASGANAVQVVWSSRRGSRNIEHIGSAHDDAELEALKAAARQRLAAGQGELDLGLGGPGPSGPLEIASSRAGHLLDALSRAYDALGFPQAAGHDEVFRQLVLARIIEPTSKQDSLRVLDEAGSAAPSYPTLNRRLPVWRKSSGGRACRAGRRVPRARLLQGTGLEPQITIGLLTGQDGFPLMVSAFEGNKAETKTMLPVIKAFMAARRLPDVTVVADAGMISEANQKAIEAEGPANTARHRRAGRQGSQGRRRAGTGQAKPVHRPGRRGQEREPRARGESAGPGRAEGLRHQPRDLPRRHPVTADSVIGSYHELWNIEKSFRMSKHDLRARPVYHRKRDSIEAHLTIVFAALAVTRFIETRTGWSIKKFVRAARRYRTIQVRAGQHVLTAEDPLPADFRDALSLIK